MLSLALLTGLLVASALATPVPQDIDVADDDRAERCVGVEERQEIYDSHKLMVALEKNHTCNYSHINVDVYIHVILGLDTDWNITSDVIERQVEILNKNYQPADISFTLQRAKWITDPDWDRGDNLVDMQKALHEGGSNALNIYYVSRVEAHSVRLAGLASHPSHLGNPDGPLLDGLLIHKGLVSYEENLITHETGHWFGLLHPFEDICNDEGDYIKDTPATPRSCYDQVYTCHSGNFMGLGWGKNFTAGQITRMHSFWNNFRSSGKVVAESALTPLEPTHKNHTKLPFYPEPGNRREFLRRCRLKADDGSQETRENYCGTDAFCRWELFKLSGEEYSSIDACLNARTVALLPWTMSDPDSPHFQDYCYSNDMVDERVCGTDMYCKMFDHDNAATDAQWIDSQLHDTRGKYSSSSECLQAHDPAPDGSQASQPTVPVRQCHPRYKLEVVEGRECPEGTTVQDWEKGMPAVKRGADGCFHFIAKCK
ncbi:hypothetical protein XA68_14452 [Ophiocordyceps unilateralis]|uniref:Peptidase M43 pregnancy-associated plasma-A domain-containing protein n=1 Tax=Ophiocordyceps unilateralis TaxID=268505 RepID=A0A2A9PA49_OPHUN|nr:hypothetical protein XA68_14452 [Ophiocordyceps unilateralis]